MIDVREFQILLYSKKSLVPVLNNCAIIDSINIVCVWMRFWQLKVNLNLKLLKNKFFVSNLKLFRSMTKLFWILWSPTVDQCYHRDGPVYSNHKCVSDQLERLSKKRKKKKLTTPFIDDMAGTWRQQHIYHIVAIIRPATLRISTISEP